MSLSEKDVGLQMDCLYAENERLRADAQRYRWLRGEVGGPHLPLAQVVWKLDGNRNSADWANIYDGQSLDDLIDGAALATTPARGP